MSYENALFAVPGLAVTMFYDTDTGEVKLAKQIGDERQVLCSLGSLTELTTKVKYSDNNSSKIQAVRLVKLVTGWDLRKSKEYMDAL